MIRRDTDAGECQHDSHKVLKIHSLLQNQVIDSSGFAPTVEDSTKMPTPDTGIFVFSICARIEFDVKSLSTIVLNAPPEEFAQQSGWPVVLFISGKV